MKTFLLLNFVCLFSKLIIWKVATKRCDDADCQLMVSINTINSHIMTSRTGTVMFLGKGVVMAGLIILLVQVIAGTEVCYIEGDTGDLPLGLQRMVMEPSPLQSYRCPYSES